MRPMSLSDFPTDERELRCAAAKASLREGWLLAVSSRVDSISDEEIDREIAEVRRIRASIVAEKRRPT